MSGNRDVLSCDDGCVLHSSRALVGLLSIVGLACGGGEAGDGDSSANADSSGSMTSGMTVGATLDPTVTTGTDPTNTGSDSSGGSTTGDPQPPVQLAPLCPEGLPFDYTRPDIGEPVDAAALTAATESYLALLAEVDFFDVVDGRVHGWPRDDAEGRYWFGTWWSGVTIVKQDGAITFRHGDQGADNNGLRTGPLLEGLCYASALWEQPRDAMLVRRMTRGFSAWMRATVREVDDPDAPMLCRAFYPQSIAGEEDGRAFAIDYDQNHPGIDADPSSYVHVPSNPDWGDVWIKNKRSKDDVGHMLRAVAQLGACSSSFVDPEAAADFEEVRTLYAAWARKVEDDGWRIATLDADGALWLPDDLLARFVEAECASKLALRLLGHFDAGDLECENGIGLIDAAIIAANDHNGNILRSFHEAAANNALLSGNDVVAQALLEGLALRIGEGVDGFDGTADPVPHLGTNDLFDMIAHGAAAGVPLTSREVRFVHERIEEALVSYANPDLAEMIAVFEASTPDGEYGYEPYGDGINFVGLASLLGTCASPCVNPTSQPVLDCELVRAAMP